MQKILLTRNGIELLGTDGLMYIDGRKNLHNQILQIKERNKRYAKNFPHKIADGFYKCNDRLKKITGLIEFNNIN